MQNSWVTQTLMVETQNCTTPLEQVWQFLIKLGIHLHLILEKTSLITVTESGSMVTWGWSWGGGQGENIEELMGLMEKSSVLIMVAADGSIYLKTHQNIHSNYCTLYLNKVYYKHRVCASWSWGLNYSLRWTVSTNLLFAPPLVR